MRNLGIVVILLSLVVGVAVGVEAIQYTDFRYLPLDDSRRSPGYTGSATTDPRYLPLEQVAALKKAIVPMAEAVEKESCDCDKEKAAVVKEKSKKKAAGKATAPTKKKVPIFGGLTANSGALVLVAILAIVAAMVAMVAIAVAGRRQPAPAAPVTVTVAGQPQQPPAQQPPAP